MTDPLLKAEMIRDEGMRLDAYPDSLGFWTIGIGHLLGKEKRMTSITAAECDALYAYDIDAAEQIARECVPMFDALPAVRQRALVNMAFNRGDHMRTSTTITPAINAAVASGTPAAWEAVAAAMLSSEWAQQVGIRAKRLAGMLQYGTT